MFILFLGAKTFFLFPSNKLDSVMPNPNFVKEEDLSHRTVFSLVLVSFSSFMCSFIFLDSSYLLKKLTIQVYKNVVKNNVTNVDILPTS